MSRQSELAALGRVADTGALSNRRLTYNGAMNVWQRGTSDDTATSADYMCDRWAVYFGGLDGNVDWDQETSSTPDGFANALKVSTDASETSLDAGDYLLIAQRFEGQDVQHLQKGTSGAKKLALSFWVRSSVASTYTVEVRDNDNTRTISKSYAISTADTWEYKTIIIEGDTTGSLDNDANLSLELLFWIDGGSTYNGGTFSTAWQADDADERLYDTTGWLESTSPTFYITGVQLEVNTVTDFEHRSYGQELALCQRYYQKPDRYYYGFCVSTADVAVNFEPLVSFRASPTASLTTTSPTGEIPWLAAKTGSSSTINATHMKPDGADMRITGFSGLTQYQQFSIYGKPLEFDAEL